MSSKRIYLSLSLVVSLGAGACERDGKSTQPPSSNDGSSSTTSGAEAGSNTRLQALVPWPDLDAAPAKAVAGGQNDAAVIVALESYTFVPAVPGAMANGLAWQRYFTQAIGLSVDRVRILSNAEATKEEIEKALDRAAQQAAAGGRVWFVFIGHGAPSRSGEDGLLLGSDVQRNTDSIELRSLRHSEVITRLERSAAQPVLVLDACFSGQTAGEETLCEGCQPVALADVSTPKRAIVLSAAKADQVAGALPGRAQPAFSYLVLGALRGWGDGDNNGSVTANEVIAYATTALGAVVKGRTQTPELLGDGRTTLIESAGERGPDLVEIQRILSQGGAVQFNADGIVLTELPTLTLRDVGRDELAGEVDLGAIDIAKEKQMEAQYLALQNAKMKIEAARAAAKDDPTGVKQEKAWCELAELGDPNPYRKEAQKACAEVRSYVEQRKRLVAAMQRDWQDKVGPFMGLQHRSVEDKRKVMKAFVDAYKVLGERSEVGTAVRALATLERGELPSFATMVQIAGGSFGGRPLAAFYLDATEVTVEQYRACVDAGVCKAPIAWDGSHTTNQYCNWGAGGKSNHPINCVSATDADAYCGWLGKRLPNEPEWEWAARGREQARKYPWGSEEPGNRPCWHRYNRDTKKGEGTCAVGSNPEGASVDGVQDLAGNVYEWTSTTEGSKRVLRGGSWDDDGSTYLQTTDHFSKDPAERTNSTGFRCAE